MTALTDGKTEKLALIISSRANLSRHVRVLVVGCGDGLEAAILAQVLGAQVRGIDTRAVFGKRFSNMPGLTLSAGDATDMQFADGSFDLVYSYHALEHIPDYQRAVSEMRRVLRPAGWIMIGVPNRRRVLGYIGSKDMTLAQKIRGNAIDWAMRFHGRFRNEQGAHAGFSGPELASILGRHFGHVTDISPEYFRVVYPKAAGALSIILFAGIDRFLFPSVYFLGKKQGGHGSSRHGHTHAT